LHQDGFEIVQGARGFEFVYPDGRKFPQVLTTQFPDAEPHDGSLFIEDEHRAQGLRITARTAITRWNGESMDYGFAVGVLMNIADARAPRPQQGV
jgi:hypothetical protein